MKNRTAIFMLGMAVGSGNWKQDIYDYPQLQKYAENWGSFLL